MRMLMRFISVLAAGFLVLGVAGSAFAQTAPAPVAPPPEKVKQWLQLLDDPEVKAWLDAKQSVPATAAPEDTVAGGALDMETQIRNHIGRLKTAFTNLPTEFTRATRVASADLNAGQPGKVALIVAILLGVGYAAERLFRRVIKRAEEAEAQVAPGEPPLNLLADLVPLLVFTIASAGLFLAFEWPPLLRKFVLTYLIAFILFRLVRTLARLVLAPEDTTPLRSARLLQLDDVEASFWYLRVQIFAGIFLLGWAIVSLMPFLTFSREATQLIAYIFGLGLLATSVECVWRRPHGTEKYSRTKAWLLTFYLVILWLIWVAGLIGMLWIGIYALLLPKAISGVGHVAARIAGRSGATTLFGTLTNVFIIRGARAVLITAAVAWLAYIWRIRAAAWGESDTVERIVMGLLHGIIILLIADLLWQLSKAFINHSLNASTRTDGTPEEIARRGRLRTLLPIFRNVLAVFIAVVAVLTILSGMGVAIGPIIAGAGIFGVAIGFGSQTLVKDVISGVFFMLDDAFRVGEYIQSGSYKGTVESFSLRSVRLRHQRGPIFTVPFGDLGAVQNMSRDWVIEKMMINVTYDSDIELAKKLIKKIGQELAEDPEFKASTLQPLKMQGVDSFGDFAIVIRMKLMTKPGEQFGIKRKALLMIKKAFDENGIKIATPTVQVSGGDDNASAAAHETLRRQKAAQAAATPA